MDAMYAQRCRAPHPGHTGAGPGSCPRRAPTVRQAVRRSAGRMATRPPSSRARLRRRADTRYPDLPPPALPSDQGIALPPPGIGPILQTVGANGGSGGVRRRLFDSNHTPPIVRQAVCREYRTVFDPQPV